MKQDAKEAFKKTSLGAKNAAYDIIAKLDPEYFEKLKGLYVDGTFGREGALPRKTKELIMIGITCALNRPRGVRLHCERALALGVSPREVPRGRGGRSHPRRHAWPVARSGNLARHPQGKRNRV